RHTRSKRDWSSDVCSSDLAPTDFFQRVTIFRPVHQGCFRSHTIPTVAVKQTPGYYSQNELRLFLIFASFSAKRKENLNLSCLSRSEERREGKDSTCKDRWY